MRFAPDSVAMVAVVDLSAAAVRVADSAAVAAVQVAVEPAMMIMKQMAEVVQQAKEIAGGAQTLLVQVVVLL